MTRPVIGPPPEHVTHYGDELDEVFLAGVHAHLERLSGSGAYLHLWDERDRAVSVDFGARKGRLVMTVTVCEGIEQEYR